MLSLLSPRVGVSLLMLGVAIGVYLSFSRFVMALHRTAGLVVAGVLILLVGGSWGAAMWCMADSSPQLSYLLECGYVPYTDGAHVPDFGGLTWSSRYDLYSFTVRNPDDSPELIDLRIGLAMPYAILRHERVNSPGCEGVDVEETPHLFQAETLRQAGEPDHVYGTSTNVLDITAYHVRPGGSILVKLLVERYVNATDGAVMVEHKHLYFHSEIPDPVAAFPIRTGERQRCGLVLDSHTALDPKEVRASLVSRSETGTTISIQGIPPATATPAVAPALRSR